MSEDVVSISVVFALPNHQEVVRLAVPRGTTVAQAVERSQLAARFPQIDIEKLHCAIFGRVVAIDQIVGEGDRVEVLRPLLIDPKENRRQAAARARERKP